MKKRDLRLILKAGAFALAFAAAPAWTSAASPIATGVKLKCLFESYTDEMQPLYDIGKVIHYQGACPGGGCGDGGLYVISKNAGWTIDGSRFQNVTKTDNGADGTITTTTIIDRQSGAIQMTVDKDVLWQGQSVRTDHDVVQGKCARASAKDIML